jgi:uncharacterized protein YegP (UPF0339 family)
MEKMMAGKFEIKLGENEKFRFNLNAQNDKRFARKPVSDDSSYSVIKAANGESIGKSGMYKTTRTMANVIASVRNHAPDAPVADGDIKSIAKSTSV